MSRMTDRESEAHQASLKAYPRVDAYATGAKYNESELDAARRLAFQDGWLARERRDDEPGLGEMWAISKADGEAWDVAYRVEHGYQGWQITGLAGLHDWPAILRDWPGERFQLARSGD